ncbi:MAG: deoxyribodipyrimidine photo-lyase [Methylobacter sp.]|nr:deoxyribodipyrimidine photo-lyase [Methylobacter sp.]
MPHYAVSLFIFRRDLRIHDNTALNEALRLSEQVLTCFIFDPAQIEPHPYQSKPALQFMLQSISDLQQQLQAVGGSLALYRQAPEHVIRELVVQHNIQAVFINRDYTPFSRRRDYALAELCNELDIALHCLPDALLNEPEQAVKNDRTPYKVFTAFYNNARQFPVPLPTALTQHNFLKISTALPDPFAAVPLTLNPAVMPGGRGHALAILAAIEQCADYLNTRDFPAQDATSKLSAHLKFGTCSVREAYYSITHQLGTEHPLQRQLYWRDFFTHIAYHFPQVFDHAFVDRFATVQWDNNQEYFQTWCQGTTGFPIVDAGMRELNATGFMHNRVRMIVASFLVKDLHINWRWGERYFAQHLVDYDPCVNNGNWQWAASTGCDAQPYFRIFNPWRQQEKFDPDCQYIVRWLPELSQASAKSIHQWDKRQLACDYPAPMLDHAYESQIAKQRYKQAAEQ